MSLTPLQREQRKQWVGASSVASVMGENPYESAYDLWAKLTGKLPDDAIDSEAIAIGDAVEPAILSLAAGRLGCKVVRPTGTFRFDGLPLAANVDGMIEKAQRGSPIVEAKSTGVAEGWGDAGTDQVPNRVLLQVQAQMMCSASDVAHVARLFGRFGFKFDLYEVPRHAILQQAIADAVGDFWKCVESDTPPEHSLISPEVAKVICRVPGKVIDGDFEADVLLGQLDLARKHRLAAEKAEKEVEAQAKTLLGDAEAIRTAGFEYAVSTRQRKEYTVKASEFKVFTLKEIKE